MANFIAFRIRPESAKSSLSSRLLLRCRVKSGVNKTRQGILSIANTHIEVGVSAHRRNNEANNALIEILSEALHCPKSNVKIVRGHKLTEKTVSVEDDKLKGDHNQYIDKIKQKLEIAMRSNI